MLTFSGSSERPVTPSKIDISLKTLAEQFKTLPDNVKEHIIPRKTLHQDIADLRRAETPEETGKQIARVHMLNHYLQHSRKGLGEKVKALPDDLGEQIMPASILIRDILAMRHPETSEDAAKQLVRFRFIESRIKRMPQNRQTALLCSSLRKNHPAFFHFLFKNTPAPDMPALLRAAVQTRNDVIFQELLHRTPVPIPFQKLNETLECLARYGQPEKLEQLLAWQPETHRPSDKQLEMCRNLAREQHQTIRYFSQLPEEDLKVRLFDQIKGRRLFPTFFPLRLTALLQTPHLNINEPNQEDGVSETALQKAIRMDDMHLFEVLLAEPRADITATTPGGSSLLHEAAWYDRSKMIESLLDRPEGELPVNIRDGASNTPLHVAVRNNKKEAVKTLLEVPDTDANAEDEEGDTPLHAAAGMGNVTIIKLLMKNAPRLNVNAPNHWGETPLHRAVNCKKASAVATLLEAPGIDINARDVEGNTPLSLALGFGDPTIGNLLRQHGATE